MTETPPAGKGRPTPKRKDAQAQRGGRVAPPPATRKEAAKRIRAQGAQKRKAVRTGTKTGDERSMMKRDQGPVRRLVRDLVDSRRHIGVLLLPATVLPVLANLTPNVSIRAIATSIWLGAVLATVSDMVLTGIVVRRRVRSDFPDEQKTAGHIGYAIVRTAQFKRFRLPPPQVSVGDPV